MAGIENCFIFTLLLILNKMELVIRNKSGEFIVSYKSFLGEFIFKFLMTHPKLQISTKNVGGVNYRGFENTTDETFAGKNDLTEFYIKPGDFVAIKNV